MTSNSSIARTSFLLLALCIVRPGLAQPAGGRLELNSSGYFEARGVNILVFSNMYGLFNDEKLSGVEIVHHGVRTATNGDVRLSPTPEQWDSIPRIVKRSVDSASNSIDVSLEYPSYHFEYSVRVTASGHDATVRVILPRPLPEALVGRAGFELEFLPSAYWEKTYVMDERSGVFPLYPSSAMAIGPAGTLEALPLASGLRCVLAPEDPERRITVRSSSGPLFLYDGRNKAQNGWFVLRSLIPAAKTGTVVEWTITANAIPGWVRAPVIGHSQVGYRPNQRKIAIIELDRNDRMLANARVMKVDPSGAMHEAFAAPVQSWGDYLRYRYGRFDFSVVKEPGIYVIEYSSTRSEPFRIADDVYDDVWQPTLDVYLPVQMDHVRVEEAYRVWHGVPHLDDARQAPTNHIHFDLYAQGPTTDSPYKPGEHIPGLNIGGWFDAGDYDIRTQTQCSVVLSLVHTWEMFRPERDETTVDERARSVFIHRPDGVPDILQQVRHGVIQLLAQQRSVGHAINGIVEAHLAEYTHLGDASTKTDNLVFDPRLDTLQVNNGSSGIPDDRWAFTNRSSALNYGSAAALAAASRALREMDDSLAQECLNTAKRIWDDEHSHAPDLFRHGNTTGGPLEMEELNAAVELLRCTKDSRYSRRIEQLMPFIERAFPFAAQIAVLAIPDMNSSYSGAIQRLAVKYRKQLDSLQMQNPYGVPITTGGWAGSGAVIGSAITNYLLYRAFPSVMDPKFIVRCMEYIYGCHPGSDISLVSGVGVHSKKIAYGNNRADFTFIAGGVVPGVLIVKPDLPENKEDWPFIWGENEYVVGLGAQYIFAALAVKDITIQ